MAPFTPQVLNVGYFFACPALPKGTVVLECDAERAVGVGAREVEAVGIGLFRWGGDWDKADGFAHVASSEEEGGVGGEGGTGHGDICAVVVGEDSGG